MTVGIGVALAFVAMLCWGFGDFFIQKATRKIGNWVTLFVITFFGAVILLPFVYKDLAPLFIQLDKSFFILLSCAFVLFFAALLDFEALKGGKLSVVEPIWSFEIPAAGILAFLILNERLTSNQIILIVLLIAGLCMVSLRERHISKKLFLEKEVLVAFAAAILMGFANFFMGWGARVTDPLMVNFFANSFIAILTGIYLLLSGRAQKSFKDIFQYKKLVLSMSITDNAAWIAFAYSMILAPIGVAVALSESYIIIAVLLGLAVNKERLQRHQKSGLVIALAAAIVLAFITAS